MPTPVAAGVSLLLFCSDHRLLVLFILIWASIRSQVQHDGFLTSQLSFQRAIPSGDAAPAWLAPQMGVLVRRSRDSRESNAQSCFTRGMEGLFSFLTYFNAGGLTPACIPPHPPPERARWSRLVRGEGVPCDGLSGAHPGAGELPTTTSGPLAVLGWAAGGFHPGTAPPLHP